MAEATPELNEFVISESEGYACMDIDTAEAAYFLLRELKSLNIEDLEPDDRLCSICQQEYCFDEGQKHPHGPVKTPCGHIFGDECLMIWLENMDAWSKYGLDAEADDYEVPVEMSNTSCPNCRREFFPEQVKDVMEELVQRILFWDLAYAYADVTRTAEEENCRRPVMEYIRFFNWTHELEPIQMRVRWKFDKIVQEDLLKFARAQKAYKFTPEHENKRIQLERIARKDLSKCWRSNRERLSLVNGGYYYAFDINCDEDEREEFKDQPMEKAFLEAKQETHNEQNQTQPDEQQPEGI
ncbi:hypothetical protein MMC07_006830 [Pseudocyphellaria aurata]|nr:hypothetical protein [Pseudocyphellaria aurata]